MVFLHQAGEFVDLAQQLVVVQGAQAGGFAAVHKTEQLDARKRRVPDARGQRCALLVHAHDDGALPWALQAQHPRRGNTQHQMHAELGRGGHPEPGDQGLLRKLPDVAGGKPGQQQQAARPEPVDADVQHDPPNGRPEMRLTGKGQRKHQHGQDQVGWRQLAGVVERQRPQAEDVGARPNGGLDDAEKVVLADGCLRRPPEQGGGRQRRFSF